MRGRGTIRGVKRRLFNLLAAVSLVLCVATMGLWTRSYSREVGVQVFGTSDRRHDRRIYDYYKARMSARSGTLALRWSYTIFTKGMEGGPNPRVWYTSWFT